MALKVFRVAGYNRRGQLESLTAHSKNKATLSKELKKLRIKAYSIRELI